MHDEGDRKALARLESVRLHDVAVDGLIVPALEAELLEFSHSPSAEQLLVHMRESPRSAALEGHGEQVRRRPEVGPGEDDGVGGRREIVDLTRPDQFARCPGRGIDGEQRQLAEIVGGRQQTAAVRSDAQLVHGGIP